MINKDNFKVLLQALNFQEKDNIYFKNYIDNPNAHLKVDFNKSELIYPEESNFIINERQTCNFSSPENFVVFECVNRLFEKGYKPEHIELEPKWKVGHGASGGRADILIKDNTQKSFLIIECKTDGYEFKKEWENTKLNGGQMLSYAKQAGSTQYVCLYSSDLDNKKVIYNSYIISLKDNQNLLESLIDKKPLSFEQAKALDVEDIYYAWRYTYDLYFETKGIFEEDIEPYKVGKQKHKLKDLKKIGSKDIQSKYHEFASIMRRYNVSGRENAFDKLVNLFLCKVVDEYENPEDLKFCWKGIANDSYFELQDRLQNLYQIGMDKFLEEKITNVNRSEIVSAFRYVKNDPDSTQETILKFFRQLKYFKNSDFSFIDVHNESLFYQNSVVLLDVVKMLQDIRLTSETQNQFLGDMFEGFLDNGVKQSEGQFFTPMPIVKFIIKSLPLENIIKSNELPPKAIDYACGAGHFLNELALQIKPFIDKNTDFSIEEYYGQIIGIEKEYRLSKVAKVSAFMYGQDDIRITYADALGKHSKVEDESFSILVANPPYSVKGFLQTLSEEERKKFTLLSTVDFKSLISNNSIETFFIERAKQLLKPEGVAAIILPASILTNDSNIYVKTREIILNYFDVISIVEFGSQTFGKTGTNTVTLFLRRKINNPSPTDHWKYRVESWFSNNETEKNYEDIYKISQYCSHIGIDENEYKSLLIGKPTLALLNTEIFIEYKKAFDNQSEIKNLLKQRTFKSKKVYEQETELNKRFNAYLHNIEKDKLYFYVIGSENKQKVLVVKYGTSTKEQQEFLGYKWSNAKGNEGIKYINQNFDSSDIDDDEAKEMIEKLYGLQSVNTLLYNSNETNDFNKINKYILENFNSNELEISEKLTSHLSYYNLVDMLDFNRKDFNKQINLAANKKTVLNTRWEIKSLGEVAHVKIGGTPARGISNYFKGNNLWVSISEMKGQIITDTKEKLSQEGIENSNVKLIPKGTTLLSFKLSIGKTALAGVDLYTNEAIAGLIPIDEDVVTNEYLFHLFSAKIIDLENSGLKAFGKSLNSAFLREDVKIPIPKKEIQIKLVDDCNMIDQDVERTTREIEKAHISIDNEINKIFNAKHEQEKISNIAIFNPSKTEIKHIDDETNVSFVEMASVSEKGFIANKVDKKMKVLRKGSYTYFRENDIIIAKITPCMENGKCALAKDLTNGIGMGSSEFHVIRTEEKVDPNFLFAMLNRESVRKEAEKNMTGSSGHRRVPSSYYENIRIPLPPLKEQIRIVKKINEFEKIIDEKKLIIEKSSDLKKIIINKYL
ncbi:N-6 DNA methylase [Flavobacterium sp. Root186]|uniref:N-6 DNA methylase n=1 Tax=Flavobacterium sp. Root186 TaxID=1736485 RepID=UPI0006F22F4B|nr:N-6 DNA methylase [Flavobacterium sp. Root186]KRB53696.1 type I restriction endonuclease subunit M [Flavobacterium sp. Root186]